MKTQVLQLLLCKYDVPFANGDTAMDLPVCKITAEGTGGSGMASFGQGTAIHHTDSVYGIQIGVIHFLPFVRGILGVQADGGQKIVFFAVPVISVFILPDVLTVIGWRVRSEDRDCRYGKSDRTC